MLPAAWSVATARGGFDRRNAARVLHMRNGRNIGFDIALDDKSLHLTTAIRATSKPSCTGCADRFGIAAVVVPARKLRARRGAAPERPALHGDVSARRSGRVDIDRETTGASRYGGQGSRFSDRRGRLPARPAGARDRDRENRSRRVFIDDATLERAEREQPALTADLMRRLAEIADERTSFNLVMTSSAAYAGSRAIGDLVLVHREARVRSGTACSVGCRRLASRP